MTLIELTEQEKSNALKEFYSSFKTGYDFEQFLKVFLEALGLDEIEVTQNSNDGGLDLKATKKGIDELTDLDSIKYYIQAKRYEPSSNVSIESVRALRGILPDGYKGIFITTGKFSKNSKKFAIENIGRPLILIDGNELINHCIKHGLGFKAKPIFIKDDISILINKEIKSESSIENDIKSKKKYIKKDISDNDIKARILPIPKTILEKIPIEEKKYKIKFEGEKVKIYNINQTRRYFGGITLIYKKYNLLDKNNNRQPKSAYWYLNQENKIIEIKFEYIKN